MSRAQGFEGRISDRQLLKNLRRHLERGRVLEGEIVAHVGEVDARRLYLEQACPSMFHYCVHVLHLAEGVAYKRIAVARAARRFPELLAALESGEIHLTAASLLAPHLDRECVALWLAAARHKSAQQIKQWIADRKPRADVKTSLRRMPAHRSPARRPPLAADSESTPAGVAVQPASAALRSAPGFRSSAVAATPGPRPVSAATAATASVAATSAPAIAGAERDKPRYEPLGADRYCVRFTVDAEVHAELQELRALLRHQIPDGDVAKIIGRAVHALLAQARKRKCGAASGGRPTEGPAAARSGFSAAAAAEPSSAVPGITPAQPPSKKPARKIPVALRRAVWKRDEGCCSYVSREGRRCGTRGFLEFHHEVPWARCREHRAGNIHLRCRAHNQHAAELDFGAQRMDVYRRNSREAERAIANAAAAERGADWQAQLDSDPA